MGAWSATSGGRGPDAGAAELGWTWSTESSARVLSARSSGVAATWQLASFSTSASSLAIAASTAAASSPTATARSHALSNEEDGSATPSRAASAADSCRHISTRGECTCAARKARSVRRPSG